MMTTIKHIIGLVVIMIGFSTCTEKYTPDLVSSSRTYLVVEGVLNVNGPTSVHITRTAKLDAGTISPELSAQVTVEGKDNSIRPLVSGGNGFYTSTNLNLILNNEYRLRIRTAAGKEYLSEYVMARLTPAIDSVGWKVKGDNLGIYVNAHDVTGNTRYYRWDYDETWEIQAFYHSYYIYEPASNTVRPRTLAEDVSHGWKYHSSTNVILGSSAKLQSDIISEAPVNTIPGTDERLSVRYSILLRQYALDQKGYDFYDLIKATTEDLGTIFDSQPSMIKGNIKCVTDPSELIIGYISASTIVEKRMFVTSSELPNGWLYYQDCATMFVKNNPDSIRISFEGGAVKPYDAQFSPFGAILGYFSAYAGCVDVTERGASVVKPPYW